MHTLFKFFPEAAVRDTAVLVLDVIQNTIRLFRQHVHVEQLDCFDEFVSRNFTASIEVHELESCPELANTTTTLK